MGMVGEACLPSNAYYPRTPDYTLCSGVHVCWSEHSDSSFVYGFMILNYGFGTMTAITYGNSLIRGIDTISREVTLSQSFASFPKRSLLLWGQILSFLSRIVFMRVLVCSKGIQEASCLTAVKKHWIRYYDTVYERDGINYFWSIENSNDVLNKFKSKKLSGF